MAKHPQQITTADTALDDDMKSRIIKYSITMGIRTFCFVGAYFAFVADLHVLMWILVAGAVLLPYPAVIFANAGRERTSSDSSALIDSAPLAELPPATGETISSDTIPSETVPGDTAAEDSADRDSGGQDTADRDTIPGETIPGETIPGELVEDDDDSPVDGPPDTASAANPGHPRTRGESS